MVRSSGRPGGTAKVTINALLIGIAGGAASALLYATVTTGGSLVMPLFLASPLPIAIVSLGWGSLSGVVAALVAALGLAALTMPAGGLLYAIVIGAPMAIYAHLAGLARRAGPAETDVEWYPVSRILATMTLLTALSVITIGAIFGFDVPELTKEVAATLQAMDPTLTDVSADQQQALLAVVGLLMRFLPFAVSTFWLIVMVTCLTLAARIARLSGRLARPQDAFALATDLPPVLAALLIVAVIATFLGGTVALVAGAFAGALAMGFALVGFAMLHLLVRGNPAAPLVLSVAYGATFLISLPLLLFVALGLLDRPLGIRQRRLRKLNQPGGGGPTPPPAA